MTQPRKAPDIVADLLRQASVLDEKQAEVSRAAFLERVAQEDVGAGRFSRHYLWAPLAAAAAILFAFLAWPATELEYSVKGAEEDSGYIRVLEKGPASVEFTDATRLSAAPGSRLRILETDEKGARVSLEEGELTVHVTHTSTSAWSFGAGPFQVRVTGTRFLLNWDPTKEQLRVKLLEGSVEVEGYSDSGPVAVRAGQSFLGDARTRTMQVSETNSQASTSARESAALDQVPRTPSGNPAVDDNSESTDATHLRPADGKVKPFGPSATTDGTKSWTTLVSRGQFAAVVDDAQQRGVASCLASCDASDLGALADAARYTGQGDLASKSLLAVRSRFTGTSRVRAAFLLGRLYEGQGAHDKARTWYETSLQESPAGGFAGESLAGKMRALLALQGKAAAAPVAKEYLRRYPGGVHASAARQLIQP